MNGVLFVTIPGEVKLPQLFADNWATPLKVRSFNLKSLAIPEKRYTLLCLQMQLPTAMRTMVLALVQSTWTMLLAVAVRVD